jgi:hypothetical protein
VTDFMNLKIKSAQCFRDANRDKVCMRVLVSNRIYMSTVS